MAKSSLMALVLGALTGTCQLASAQVISWDAAVGDWFQAGNWNPAVVPGSLDDASINNGGTASASNAAIEAANLSIGRRTSGLLLPPFWTGTLNLTNGDALIAADLNVGVTDTTGILLGSSTGAFTTSGGGLADGDVTVGGEVSVGRFKAGPGGTATGTLDLQAGDLTGGGGQLLRVGTTDEPTSGSADGTATVAGDVSGFVIGLVGSTGLRSSGNATGDLTIGGTYSGGSGLQIATAGGAGIATGSAQVGAGVSDVSFVSVGGGGGDPNATGSSTGQLAILAGGAQGTGGSFSNFSVGTTNGPATSQGSATVQGGISGFDRVNVGVTFNGTAGSATGLLDVQTGSVIGTGSTQLLRVGTTGDEFSSGSADGTAVVAGDVSGFLIGLVGSTGLRSSGNATGDLTIGGTYSGGSGLQIATAGGAGIATGSAQVGAGVSDVSFVSVGGGGGDPNATGSSTGQLAILAGGAQGTGGSFSNFSVGTTNGPATSLGTAVVQGGISGFQQVNVGVTFDGTAGSATGLLTLVDGGIQTGVLEVGSSNGTGTAQGTLDIGSNLVTVADSMLLGGGATIELDIDGFLRGIDYGAFDVGSAVLDGALEVMFSFTPSSGIFDLIVSEALNGIVGDFGSVSVLGLEPGTAYSAGIVTDQVGGMDVEIYRLTVGSGQPMPAPAPGTLVAMLAGLISLAYGKSNSRRSGA